MDNFKLPEKLFFREREAIKIIKVSKKVIDYWLKIFPFFNIEENSNGEKLIKREDIILLLKIKDLILNQEKTIDEAIELLKKEVNIKESKEINKEKKTEKTSSNIDSSILNEIKREIKSILTILKKNSKT